MVLFIILMLILIFYQESSCMRLHRSLVRFPESDSGDEQALQSDIAMDNFSNDSSFNLLHVATVTS